MNPPEPLSVAVADFEALRRDSIRKHRLQSIVGVAIVSIIVFASMSYSDVFSPALGGDPMQRIATFLDRLAPDIDPDAAFAGRATRGSIAAWYYDFPNWLAAAWQTIQMAVVGTMLGGLLAVGAAFFAAQNVMRIGLVRFLVRRVMDALRTIPDLILAIIFSAAFGLGAVAGVVTIIVVTLGSLAKLFSEAIESVDMRPAEALKASGAGWIAQMRYGVVPQVLPNFASYLLLRLEINISVAAALGIVGAGGIGVELQRAITYTEFDTYLALLLMIVAMITLIDMASEELRHRLIGKESMA
ncbi:MAG: phosphonate ABC transporter, permease protein PhnE [Hyphomonadaceae bacterium]|nr:MAG: phosphonate ABC transporter permease [Caulobacteraceae bacterium]MBT9445662.1 phosphonate ABC transporter, permease protein PhnE [Hyphomonadaceae bacterium]TPW05565.1 MAG: phosphonate ABC transporter permease [Alphaproteobacteria bacterium]